MSKSEIYLELEAITRDCRDIAVYFAISDLKRKIQKDIDKEGKWEKTS